MASETTVKIEKLVYGGDGLARSEGRVVLAPYVLPGELVRMEVERAKNDLLRGKAVEILEGSPERIEPTCPYFGRCGGCHYQHSAQPYQEVQKLLILREALRRVGHIEFAGEIELVTADPWHYRNRTQLHVHNGTVGYFAAGSHEVIPIDHCPISSPRLNEAIAMLARDLPHYRWFDATVELFTNETETQVNVLDRVPHSVAPLFETIGTREPIDYAGFRVSRGSFFQVNRLLIDRLVSATVGSAEGQSAVDLYAGVGLFARALAQRFASVTAVETSGSAFRDLQANMAKFGVPVTAVKQTSEQFLAGLLVAPDWVIADPPRAGLGKVVLSELTRLRPANITIVSCDPATLARDLGPLVHGGYRIAKLQVVDLFPQTFHLETVVHLAR